MKKDYIEFLQKKQIAIENSGFDLMDSEMNENLFPFQKILCETCCKSRQICHV